MTLAGAVIQSEIKLDSRRCFDFEMRVTHMVRNGRKEGDKCIKT